MRIALLSAPYKPDYMRNARCDFVSWSKCQWYPILLGYCGAFLEKQGHVVKLIDAQAAGIDAHELENIMRAYKPELTVAYAGRESIHSDLAIAGKYAPAVVVGPFVPLVEEDIRDFIKCWPGRNVWYAKGDFEHAVSFLSLMLEENGLPDPDDFGPESRLIEGRPLTSQLDDLDVSRFFIMQGLDHRHYRAPSEPYPHIDIMSSRGCYWGRCTYCLWPKTMRRSYYERPVVRVVDEMEWIQKNTAYKSIMFQDDAMSGPRISLLSQEYRKRGLTIPWSCMVRPNIGYGALCDAKAANCLNLHVGYESGNDATLSRIWKGINTTQMEYFTGQANKVGLRLHGDFMIGIDSTETEIDETISWACDVIDPHTAQFQIFIDYGLDRDEPTPQFSREWLEQKAREAYRRFYLRPHKVGEILRQVSKPGVFGAAVRSVLGGRGGE